MTTRRQAHEQYPRFRIATLLWVMALLAAGMGTFGAGAGILLACLVIAVYLFGWPRFACLGCLLLTAIVVVPIAILPTVLSTFDSARRTQSYSQLKQLVLALHIYHDRQAAFPPAYTVDANGNPVHSWRTLILPCVEESQLYRKINLDEPWNSAANSKLLKDQGIEVLRSPRQAVVDSLSDETHYFAAVDDGAALRPGKGGSVPRHSRRRL